MKSNYNQQAKIKKFLKQCKKDIIFFAEHMLRTEDGSFYKLEEHQKAMVSSAESQVIYFCGRRLRQISVISHRINT